jgi:hypothetical protein
LEPSCAQFNTTIPKDIDRTLIRENLKLTAEDRFRQAMTLARFAD